MEVPAGTALPPSVIESVLEFCCQIAPTTMAITASTATTVPMTILFGPLDVDAAAAWILAWRSLTGPCLRAGRELLPMVFSSP